MFAAKMKIRERIVGDETLFEAEFGKNDIQSCNCEGKKSVSVDAGRKVSGSD
jgi:hypothetical protein